MYWKELQEYKVDSENFRVLKELNRAYQHYMDLRINQMNFIDLTISQTFPGIKKLIPHGSNDFSKDKLLDFLEIQWHKNLVLKKSEEKFIEDFKDWAKEKMDKCSLISSFEDLYFKDVLIMSKEEFEDFLENKDKQFIYQ